MADFSYLLGQPQAQFPNPLDLAGKAMTLGGLAAKVGMANLQLQQNRALVAAMQDPAVMSAIFGGGAPGTPQGAAASPASMFTPDIAAKYGPGLPLLMTQALNLREKQAEIAKNQADAAQAQQSARVNGLKALGSEAAQLLNSKTPPTLSDMQRMAYNAKFLGVQDVLGTMPSVMDQDGTKQWLGSVVGLATSALDQANANQVNTLTPLKAGLTQAQTGEATATAAAKPIEAQSGRISALAAAEQAGTARDKFLFGTVAPNPVTGLPQRIAPASATDLTPVVSGAVTPSGDAAPATGLSAAQGGQKNVLETRLKTAGANADFATRIQTLVPAMRQLIASGYNGTLAGSSAGKAILNTMSTLGLLSPDQSAKLSNMRASDALNADFMAQIAREMSTRGSNMALTIAQQSKPGSENSTAVRLRMIDAMNADANNLLNYNKSVNQYVSQNPGDLGLTGFSAPTPVGPPASTTQRVSALPDPAQYVGATAAGDDGVIYRSNGKAWVRVK
jgi:hypothetical protein